MVIGLSCLPVINFIFVFLYDLCLAASAATVLAASGNAEKITEAAGVDSKTLRKSLASVRPGLKNVKLSSFKSFPKLSGAEVSYDSDVGEYMDEYDNVHNPHISAQELSVRMRRNRTRASPSEGMEQGAVTKAINDMRGTLTSWLTAINVLSAQGQHTKVDDSESEKEDRERV